MTPLKPTIELADLLRTSICGTCGVEDGTVRQLSFRWRDVDIKSMHGGGTSISLCRACRGMTLAVLMDETSTKEA